jgi:hypothetical protein
MDIYLGKLERQIANHLKQIQDRQKQRKKDNINTTRYEIKQSPPEIIVPKKIPVSTV